VHDQKADGRKGKGKNGDFTPGQLRTLAKEFLGKSPEEGDEEVE